MDKFDPLLRPHHLTNLPKICRSDYIMDINRYAKFIKIAAGLSSPCMHDFEHPLFTRLFFRFGGFVKIAQWLSGRALDLRSLSRGFDSHTGQLGSNLGQVVHTYLPLSPSSITWYRSQFLRELGSILGSHSREERGLLSFPAPVCCNITI